MREFQMLLHFLIFVYLIGGQTISSQTCYQTEAAFAADCASQYGGVVNGGRCFYIGGGANTRQNWTNSWTQCAKTGGTLAQIHTQNELNDILSVTAVCTGNCTGVWVALMRNSSALLNADIPGIIFNIHNMTYWYDDNMQVNHLLSSTNTWIGGYEQDAGFCQGHNCFVIDGNNVSDQSCSANNPTLCVVYNPFQNFTYVPNICMSEPVVETFQNANSTADCALYCVNYSNWCRSYNYYPATKQCDLFSWYCTDTTNYASDICDCLHYAYVPHSSSPNPVCPPFPTSPPALRSYMTSPGQLYTGECLTSTNLIYTACLQTNGNFVVSNGTNQLWFTNTNSGSGPAYYVYNQCDSNLCLYSSSSWNAFWCSGTNGKGPAPVTIVMQNNGNLVINDATGTELWSSETGLVGK